MDDDKITLCESCLLFEDCESVCFMTECPFYYNKRVVEESCKKWKRKHPIEAFKVGRKRKKLYKALEALEFERQNNHEIEMW